MAYGAVFRGKGDDGGDEPARNGGNGRMEVALRDWRAVVSHPEVGVFVDPGGRASLYRRGRLVVATADFDDARLLANLDDLGIAQDAFERERALRLDQASPFGTLTLGSGVNAVSAAVFLRTVEGRRPLQVGPDHLLSPSQARILGPGGLPRPAAASEKVLGQREELASAEAVVPVAVIDSGLIQPVLDTDPLLGAASAMSTFGTGTFDPLWDEASGELLHWEGGHGTHVAGVVAEAAAGNAALQHHGVCQAFGEGAAVPLVSDTAVAEAVAAALRAGCRVINMSLSGPSAAGLGTIATALVLARSNGSSGSRGDDRADDAVIVAAAGNEATSQPMYPAALKGVIAVAAVDRRRSRASFSNFGTWVDCSAAGVDVFGPYVKGKGGPDAEGKRPRFRGWARWSGTSFATPWVAGRIARTIAAGTPSARVAAAVVLSTGTPLDPGSGLGVLVE